MMAHVGWDHSFPVNTKLLDSDLKTLQQRGAHMTGVSSQGRRRAASASLQSSTPAWRGMRALWKICTG